VTSSSASSSSSTTFTTPSPFTAFLPTWLTQPQSQCASSNLQTLAEAMRATNCFTEPEVQLVQQAIVQAAQGLSQIVAGAADFVHICVGLEMGVSALVAAAAHYGDCVRARLRGGQWMSSTSSSSTSIATLVAQDAAQIAADAARLKQLEMVASRVLDNDDVKAGRSPVASGTTGHATPSSSSCLPSRVRPDARDSENLRKLLMSETRDWRALAIRSAACLFRLRGLLSARAAVATATTTTTDKRHPKRPPLTPEMIRTGREALYIYAPLASRLGMHRLKNELEGAAFMLLYQRQYQRVNPSHDPQRAQAMKHVLEAVQQEMTTMLEQDAEFQSLVSDFTVTSRVKEPYSLWKKLLRRPHATASTTTTEQDDILQVPDALALRIVLTAKKLTADEPLAVTRARERALCYYAQTLCVQRWKPAAEPRFKDYIERPKRNGYQSLHYTAEARLPMHPGNHNSATADNSTSWTVEIQVRSSEMHQVAEFGLASHWEYKAQSKKKAKPQQQQQSPLLDVSIAYYQDGQHHHEPMDLSSDAYLRKVQEWHWQHHGGATKSSLPSRPIRLLDEVESEDVDEHDGSMSSSSSNAEALSSATEGSLNTATASTFTKDASSASQSSSSSPPHVPSKLRAERIRARNQRLQPYLQALSTAQSDLTRQYVFIFLTQQAAGTPATASEGKVLALPSGACVIDALREGERTLGYPMVWMEDTQLALNGAATSVTRQLSNGDVLTFPTTAMMGATTTAARP